MALIPLCLIAATASCSKAKPTITHGHPAVKTISPGPAVKTLPLQDTDKFIPMDRIIWSPDRTRKYRLVSAAGPDNAPVLTLEAQDANSDEKVSVSLGPGRQLRPVCMVDLKGGAALIDLTKADFFANTAQLQLVNAASTTAPQPKKLALLVVAEHIKRGIKETQLILLDSTTLRTLWRETASQAGQKPFASLKLRILPAKTGFITFELLQHALPTGAGMPGPPLTLHFAADTDGQYHRRP